MRSRRSTFHGILNLAASLILAGTLGSTFAIAGIIELGAKGQKGNGSIVRVVVEGNPYFTSNLKDRLAEDILEDIRLALVADGYTATTVVHATRNAISVTKAGGGEVLKIEVLEDDTGLRGSGVEYTSAATAPRSPRFLFTEVDSISGDGEIRIAISTANAGALPDVVVNTASIGTAQNATASIIAQLEHPSRGFTVTPVGTVGGSHASVQAYFAHRPGDKVLKAIWSNTDSGVGFSSIEIPPTLHQSIPALTSLGLVVLAMLLGLSAAAILRRRRAAGAV